MNNSTQCEDDVINSMDLICLVYEYVYVCICMRLCETEYLHAHQLEFDQQ